MQHFSSKDFKVLYKHALIKPHKQPEVGDFLPLLQECQLWHSNGMRACGPQGPFWLPLPWNVLHVSVTAIFGSFFSPSLSHLECRVLVNAL